MTEADVSGLLISELSDEEIKSEREKTRAEDEALEKLEAERLREKGLKSKQEQELAGEIGDFLDGIGISEEPATLLLLALGAVMLRRKR